MQQGLVLIQHYFPEISPKQASQFNALEALYRDWNEKINVISRKDIGTLYERHVLHSLSIAKLIKFERGTQVMDVGTGGGFPGIPLAILMPHVNFYLVDSIAKKIKVVNSITEKIGLQNVKSEQIRAEDVQGEYDFVVSRAVTRLKPFVDWVGTKIKKRQINHLQNGIFCLKGGDINEEVREVEWPTKIFPLSNFFREPFFETKKIVYLHSR